MRGALVRLLPVAVTLALSACGAREPARPPGAGSWSNAGGFYALWRPLDSGEPLSAVPLNEEFTAEVHLFADEECSQPLEGAAVVIDCRMPAHGHGMLADVPLEHQGGGRYLARGMLCHMPGHWELQVDLTRGAVTERAQFDIELE